MEEIKKHPIAVMAEQLERVHQVAANTPVDIDSIKNSFSKLTKWQEQISFFWDLLSRSYNPMEALVVSKAFEELNSNINCHTDLKKLLREKQDDVLTKSQLSAF
jgi:hypothetical protein